MTWVLKSKLNVDKDYRHFGPPFLLAVDELFANVRNLTLRHLPYDLSEPGRVKVRVIGQILDPNYTRMLMVRTDLPLEDVIALDKVQKGQPLNDWEFRSLKTKRLIEGRRPKLHVSAEVARATDTVEDYLRRRGIDKTYCKKMVVDFLKTKGNASRAEIISLLAEKLSDALTDEQKRNFIRNLLQEMRRKQTIVVEGRGTIAKWGLANGGQDTSA